MSLMTTWTTAHVPPLRPLPDRPEHLERGRTGPRPAWDCVNCALLNPGRRRRCADCGTRRG